MNQINQSVFAKGPDVATDAQIMSQFHNYLRDESADLIQCCAWLGGRPWELRAARLIATMRQTAFPEREQLKELGALHCFLRLDLVDDLDSPEAARFAELNLHDVRVERCCRHCDTIGDFIATFAAESAETPAAAA